MQIEINAFNRTHRINTGNARLAGEWLAEKLAELMSANAALNGYTLSVWPETDQEHKLIGQPRPQTCMDEEGLTYMADVLLLARDRITALRRTGI